ncbi:MAG: preprotein translocase subunit SecG [Bacteroidota bacterium]|nr:preprotein translocase subunit SecG [Bacteroidota bacterium]
MLTFILIIIIVVCLFLTLLVLIQNPKGGIAANFIAPSQIMGVKRSTDVVEKATWVLAIALISLSLLSNFFRPDATNQESTNSSRIEESIQGVTVPAPPPQTPAAQPANTQPTNK